MRGRGNGGMDAGDGDDVAAEVGELPSRHGESASDDDDAAGGGLLVSFDGTQAGRRKSGAAIAQQWFAQDVFQVRQLSCMLPSPCVPPSPASSALFAKPIS